MKPGALTLVLLAALSAVGCGTLANHNPEVSYANCAFRPNRIYGGVRADAEVLATPVGMLARGQSLLADHPELPGEVPSQEEKIIAGVMLKPTALLDLPLSFVADTIMLPWDIAAQWDGASSQPAPPSRDERSRLVRQPVNTMQMPPRIGGPAVQAPATSQGDPSAQRSNAWQISPRVDRPAIQTAETPSAKPSDSR